MTEVHVTADFEVAPDTLWKLVADFGNVSWIPGMTDYRVEGSGPGMIRFLPAGDKEIHERLDSVDETAKAITYSIPQNVPFAVTDYRATMKVDETDGGCRLTWSCTCEPDGISDEEAQATVSGLYEMMIGWIRDHLSS